MGIIFSPKVGEVLECHFGVFAHNPGTMEVNKKNFNGRIPPEIVKKRLVVVMNGKLSGGCIVVPISSSEDIRGIREGTHIEVPSLSIKITDFYDNRKRWAKAELIQMVSNERLFKLGDQGVSFKTYLEREKVTEIQLAVIKAINAKNLIT